MTRKREKYLWERKTDTSLQFWPSGNKERSLIKPTVPPHLVKHNIRANCTAPEPLPFDIMRAHFINHSAISEFAPSFYTERAHEKFNYIGFTFGGAAEIKAYGKLYTLKTGSMYFASTKAEYQLRTKKAWKFFFFHLMDCPYWKDLTQETIIIRKSKHIADLYKVTEMYMREVYKPDRSQVLLELLANLIEYYIRAEFREDGNLTQKLEGFLTRFNTDKSVKVNAKDVAADFGISVYELDKLCARMYGKKLAKLLLDRRMAEARTSMLDKKSSLDEIAKSTGFADRHSLSKTFRKYYKMSPREFAAKLSGM